MEGFINNFNKHALKKWSKLNASIYTRLFVLCSIFQCIIITILQIRILLRNINLGLTWNDYQARGNFTQDGCQQFQDKELPKFPFLPFDNMIFIMFQAFQLYFCFNAIFHEHIIQILTITILNFCWALYGTVQAVEVKIELGELNDLSKCVNQSSVVAPPDFLGNDIPCVIVLLMLAFIMSYLSYKLYKQFGWVNYKRIGGDPKMRYIYKKHLIFLMLLKLNLLSMLLFMIPSLSLIILLISNISKLQDKGFLIGFIIYHLAVTVMVLILEILAYRFVATEHRLGMIIFLVLWIAVIVDFVFATVSAFALFAQLKSYWYFGIIILVLLIINSVILLVFGVKVLRNFGQGLKELINKNETQEESTPQNPGGLAHIWDDLEFEPSREKKWTIDE